MEIAPPSFTAISKPRPSQTDGRQEINRSAASGDGRGAWGYDEGQKDKDKRDKGKR